MGSATSVRRSLVVLLLGCGLSGCGPETRVPEESPRTCFPSGGATGAPKTIEEALALINALPRPTSAACLVESLDRPLRVNATSSAFSAQPAQGKRSPRIFLFSGPLIISVVPEGIGAEVVEFSQLLEGGRSIKGELTLPVTEPLLPPEAPYVKVMFNDAVTSCALCHPREKAAYAVGTATAYASQAIRPDSKSEVSLEALRADAAVCDVQAEPQRCELLREIFDGQAPVPQNFPQELRTFFN